MPAGLYFVLKYFLFTFLIHLAYSDTWLQRHICFGPFDVVITEFDCIFESWVLYNEKCLLGYKNQKKRAFESQDAMEEKY
jgi:hypothetical protein